MSEAHWNDLGSNPQGSYEDLEDDEWMDLVQEPSQRFVMQTDPFDLLDDPPSQDDDLFYSLPVDPEKTVPDRFLHLLSAPHREPLRHHRALIERRRVPPDITLRSALRYGARQIRHLFGRNPHVSDLLSPDEFAELLAA